MTRSVSICRTRRAFTLIELMVVIGIIAILGGITAVSFRAIAQDAKLATGKNAVTAVLDHGRSMAMKNNRIVLVVFRPRMDGPSKQFVEAVLTQWSGESGIATVNGGPQVVDRFVPIPNVSPKPLPKGVKIASPSYGADLDTEWMTLSHLPHLNGTSGEAPGHIIGVMFAPDGTCIAQNSATDSARMYVDFNDDRIQDIGGLQLNYANNPTIPPLLFNGGHFEQSTAFDEPYIDIAAFLAVFDDETVRELYITSDWVFANNGGAYQKRIADYTDYITKYADRIHFNRYTGVVMK